VTPWSTSAVADVWGLAPAEWAVIGVLLTGGGLLAAGVAAFIAARQYSQNKDVRLDQSRPYVLVTAEPSAVSRHFIEIVIQNVGAGPARNVCIKVTPPLRAARHNAQHSLENARVFTEAIDMLPPGFQIRMHFDSALERYGQDLPPRHVAQVTYSDGHGHWWDERNVLDMELQRGMLFTEEYNAHHAAKALREIAKTLKGASVLDGVIEAVVEDRATRRDRVKGEREEQQRAWEAMEARLRAQGVDEAGQDVEGAAPLAEDQGKAEEEN
jgi:hypothetical protein